MASPTISVIIPCYNAGPYVAMALDSVFAQTFRDFEVIVVDDGSKDDSLEVLKSYGDRILLLRHPGGANRGQTPSMNLALTHARGEFIACLDADDLWAPEKLATQHEFLKAHPDVLLVYSNGTAIDSAGRFQYDLFPENHVETSDPNRMLMNCYISSGNTASLIRKSAIDAVGGWNGRLQAQDHDMWLRLMERGRFAYLPQRLMHYRRHSAQSSLKRRQWEDGFTILAEAMARYKYRPSAIRARRAVLHYRLASHDLRNKRLFRATAHTLLSVAFNPSRAFRALRDMCRRLVWRLRNRGFAAMIRGKVLPD